MRPKTQQRLTILAVIIVLGLAAASALYVHMRSLRNADVAAKRQLGIDAFAKQDYDLAHSILHWYAYRVQRDPEAYYDLAVSCTKLSEVDGSLVPEAIQSFRRYLDMVNPAAADDTQKAQYNDAQHRLMNLFIREAGGESEAIRLADVILKSEANDLDALKTLAWVNARDPKHYDAALASSLRYNQLKPTDLDLQELTLRLMGQLKYPAEKLLGHADALKQADGVDPRFDLVEVMAHFEAAEIPDAPVDQRSANVLEGKKSLAATTQPDPPDAQFVNHLIFFLDGLNQFGQSLATLQRAADKLDDPQIEQAYVQRLWQDQKYAAVVDRTKTIDPATADAQVLALRVLSLEQVGQHQPAQELVDVLDKRSKTQAVAHAWAVALRARLASATQSPRDTLAQYKQAQDFDPRNSIIRYLVGETYFALGEQDLALQQWKLATSQDPSWALPHMRIAELEQAGGHANDEDAVVQAQRALWAEQTLPTVITGLYAEYNRVRTGSDIDQIKKVLADVKTLQDRIPNEPQTLPIYISLLCQTHNAADRDTALNLLDAALRAGPSGGQDVLLKLAQVSLAQQLGRENDLLDAAQKNYGLTPALAMARAGVMLATNHTSAEVIEQVRKTADAALATTQPSAVPPATMPARLPTRADWDLTIAQILELTHSPDAAAAWSALGDGNPNNLVIQDAILQSATAWTNRPFMERTVQRVHNLTTDDSLNWQIGHARLLLSGPDKKQDSAEAIHVLSHVIDVAPGQVEPRLLLATALEVAGNPQGAIDELVKANALSQNTAEILYPLVRMEYAAGNADDTRKYAANLAAIPKVSPDLLGSAASMLADQGDYALSQSLLDKAGGDATDPSQRALLAFLDWHQGKVNEASAIYFALLGGGVRDVGVIRQIADFFASQGDIEHARSCLAQLDSLNLPPGQKEQIVASFDEQLNDFTGADSAYGAAVKAAPGDGSIWAADIGYQIRRGRLDDAKKLADAATAANPGQEQLAALSDLCRKLTGLTMSPDTLALVTALTHDPTDTAARDTLDAMLDATAKNQAPQQLTIRLSALADKYPRFLPVYVLTVQRLLHANQADQALSLAQRAKDLLPNSAAAAQMLTQVYGFMGRWSDMNQAALVWRQRSLGDPMEPDTAVAISQLATGKGSDALATLQPYLKSGRADPARAELTTTYARALIAVAREDDADAFLRPLAQISPDWRAKWLSLALVTHTDAPGAIAWVRRVMPLIQAGSVVEQCLLADTWYNIGVQYGNADAFAQAQAILSPLAGRNDLPPGTLMTLASSMEQAGDKNSAEQMYRRVLQANPNMAPAQNNLAYLLLMKNEPAALAEAETLAKAAVASSPQNPQTGPYYDTLARVYLKESQTGPAEAAFAKAATLQPWNVDALLGLGNVRISTNQIDKASQSLSQIDALVRNGTISLSADQQRQVENLRDACKNIDRVPVTGTN